MLLVVDVGNTQTHIGLISAGGVVDEWRIATTWRDVTGVNPAAPDFASPTLATKK